MTCDVARGGGTKSCDVTQGSLAGMARFHNKWMPAVLHNGGTRLHRGTTNYHHLNEQLESQSTSIQQNSEMLRKLFCSDFYIIKSV